MWLQCGGGDPHTLQHIPWKTPWSFDVALHLLEDLKNKPIDLVAFHNFWICSLLLNNAMIVQYYRKVWDRLFAACSTLALAAKIFVLLFCHCNGYKTQLPATILLCSVSWKGVLSQLNLFKLNLWDLDFTLLILLWWLPQKFRIWHFIW